MAIRSNLGTGVIDIVGDTVLFNPSAAIDRYHVGSCTAINTGANPATISVYISPDLTSGSGDLIYTKVIEPLQDIDINPIVGQGYITQNVIVTADIGGVKAQLTRTEYDLGS